MKKRKDLENGAVSGANGNSLADVPRPAPERVPREGKTVIGEQISIEGHIRGSEELVFHGYMKGYIELEEHHLIVGYQGHVEAENEADNVTISGQMVGNIKATGKVEITKGADFNGEIKAKGISVEDGAYLKAVIELERESQAKPVSSAKPVLQVAPEADKEPVAMSAEADKGT